MKLNNRGWGLSTFLGFLLLFIVFLFIAVISAYRAGLSDEPGIIKFPNSNSDINNGSILNYSNIEGRLESAARMYRDDKYSNIIDSIVIKSSTLVNEKYINNIDDCNGYVIVTENSEKAYIKCKSYVTKGYDYTILQ